METYIALLRGINVGGHKKILMADLRLLLASIGLTNVATYIQSGNVVFVSKKTEREKLETKISEAIKEKYLFEVSILVIRKGDLLKILSTCPFSEEKKEKSYYTLFHQSPTQGRIAALDLTSYPDDECNVTAQCVYSFYKMGYGKAKCHNNFFETKLKVAATTRNHRTMTALINMLSV